MVGTLLASLLGISGEIVSHGLQLTGVLSEHTDTDRLTHERRHTGHARRTGEGETACRADRKYMTEREQRQEHTATTEMRVALHDRHTDKRAGDIPGGRYITSVTQVVPLHRSALHGSSAARISTATVRMRKKIPGFGKKNRLGGDEVGPSR